MDAHFSPQSGVSAHWPALRPCRPVAEAREQLEQLEQWEVELDTLRTSHIAGTPPPPFLAHAYPTRRARTAYVSGVPKFTLT